MEIGWCGSSILKGTWQDFNNLLRYHHWRYLPTSHDFGLKPDTWGRLTDLSLPMYTCQICVCARARVCMRVWSSRARRGEKCQPASPELESGEIQAGKIRDCVPSILRPCLLMIRILEDIFLSFFLSVCVQNRNKSVDKNNQLHFRIYT